MLLIDDAQREVKSVTGAYTKEELAALYRRRIGMVYQICLMLLKNVPDAEDAAQTVFRKVLERGEPFRDLEHEKAWLIVTARNECKNQLRHWWRTRRGGEEELNAITWERQSDTEVWEQLLALPERERTVPNCPHGGRAGPCWRMRTPGTTALPFCSGWISSTGAATP